MATFLNKTGVFFQDAEALAMLAGRAEMDGAGVTIGIAVKNLQCQPLFVTIQREGGGTLAMVPAAGQVGGIV